MIAAKHKTVVHVIIDTNALFTEAADKLLSSAISELIVGANDRLDLNVEWYIPWIVKSERQFQMLDRAKRLLPHLEKVERLLGHQLGITEEVLRTRVEEAIKKQIELHQMKEIGLDPMQVDWQKMIERSVFRQAPFERGETEKGFRDAILLEAFCQLASTLPRTPQVCRIVLLSSDGLLAGAARERTLDRNNVVVVNDLESLKTMLNALAAEVTQELIATLLPKASNIFFEAKDSNTLFFKAGVQQKALEQFGKIVREPPAPDFIVRTTGLFVAATPTFLAKKGQSLEFSNRFTFKVEATKRAQRQPASLGLLSGIKTPGFDTSQLDPSGLRISTPPSSYLDALIGSVGADALPQAEEIKREGEHVFEATWSVTLTAKGKLIAPKLQTINYKSSKWEP